QVEAVWGPRIGAFETICQLFSLSKSQTAKTVQKAMTAYNTPVIGRIRLFGGVRQLLAHLAKKGIKTAVITSGNVSRQKQKVKKLGLVRLVDHIQYHDVDREGTKQHDFETVLKKFDLQPNEVICVGDRVHSEIKTGNKLGMTTVRLLHGRYARLKPATKLEIPDYEITSLSKLSEIIELLQKQGVNGRLQPRIVLIGGGSGMANLLLGLKNYTKNLTAIITATDSGRSSGRIRKDFDTPAPGDIRNCLVALSNHEETLKDLFQYRFTKGELAGHSFGNIFLIALNEITGNFEKAIFEAGRILSITGKVLPATITNTQVCARLQNGQVLESEDAITSRDKLAHNRSPIVEVFLKPKNPVAPLEAIAAIQQADLVIIGPGQFYNSILSNLLVPDIRRALARTAAKKVYICNIMTQQGQTDGYTASRHIATIQRYLPKTHLDYVLLNTRMPPKKNLVPYGKEHAHLVLLDKTDILETGVTPIYADLLQKDTKKKFAFNRREYLRHDSDKVAKQLLKLL
ncbi:MAG: uridine diphosphate-N-acetylglucosamine-binding protein YvcK, partial [Candidatus Diapherotrites archaeon]|nr:uridine diphosphate-N-acetylglucosamine-binding protein YvcK [Candidatus Diapherotrites archaeon]